MTDSKAFMIVTCKIDPTRKEDYKHYMSHALPIVAAHGGQRVGQYAVAERHFGESQTAQVIVMEFPSADAIRGVFEDPKYIELIPSRAKAFPVLDILICEEFDPAALLQA